MKRVYLVLVFSIFATAFQALAQDTSSVTGPTEAAFYEWEAGIDLLPLIDKSRDGFGFIVKRNFQTTTPTERSALRLKLRPQLLRTSGRQTTGERQSSISLAVGYEKQKLYGRFSVLYGAELFLQRSRSQFGSTTVNRIVSQQTSNTIGISGFVGGRYYLGKHLAATLESHLIYQRTRSEGFTGSDTFASRANQLFVEPIHAIYLSYHF